jgi:hypothetical protein
MRTTCIQAVLIRLERLVCSFGSVLIPVRCDVFQPQGPVRFHAFQTESIARSYPAHETTHFFVEAKSVIALHVPTESTCVWCNKLCSVVLRRSHYISFSTSYELMTLISGNTFIIAAAICLLQALEYSCVKSFYCYPATLCGYTCSCPSLPALKPI